MTTSSSVTEITSVEQFQEFIKAAGPDKVVALNFWAPWAAPCEQMNKVFAELSEKYPSAAFAQVLSSIQIANYRLKRNMSRTLQKISK